MPSNRETLVVERKLGPFLPLSARPDPARGAMVNKRGQKAGTQRGNRQRFPYEPRVVGGKLMMPAELQAIRRYGRNTLPRKCYRGNQSSRRDCLARAHFETATQILMPLKMRPTGLSSSFYKPVDYIVCGEWAAFFKPAAAPTVCAGSGR
jgi:hypothetical protein